MAAKLAPQVTMVNKVGPAMSLARARLRTFGEQGIDTTHVVFDESPLFGRGADLCGPITPKTA